MGVEHEPRYGAERMNLRRILSWVFPWFVLARIRLLAESPYLYPADAWTQWDSGYERAMYEVLLNMGLETPVSNQETRPDGEV